MNKFIIAATAHDDDEGVAVLIEVTHNRASNGDALGDIRDAVSQWLKTTEGKKALAMRDIEDYQFNWGDFVLENVPMPDGISVETISNGNVVVVEHDERLMQ